jgi:hypothetical protein
MGMSQQELYDWVQKKLKNKAKYESCALMNFRAYLGDMTDILTGSEIQLLWARSLAYDAASKIGKGLLEGGWYASALKFSYNEANLKDTEPPTVFLGKEIGNKQGQFSGAGQCAWFMDRIGDDLRGPAVLKQDVMKVLGCYHSGWKHNFVALAPDAITVTANDLVVVDAWALAFGTPAATCWGVKANESWLADHWNGVSIKKVY